MSDYADHFAPIETAICTAFLPAILGGTTPTTTTPNLCALLYLPVKSAGVGVPNLTKSAGKNHTTSSVCTSVLTNSLLDGTSLVITDHQAAMRKGQGATQSSKRINTATALYSLFIPMDASESRQTTRNIETGTWISVQPTLVNGLSLSKDELRDTKRKSYGLGLVDMPQCCDGCGAKFTIEHALHWEAA